MLGVRPRAWNPLSERETKCQSPREWTRPRIFPYLAEISGVDRMITSKLTSKAQTTIPQPVRAALGLGPGDEIAYAIEDGRVLLTKACARIHRGMPFDDPFATFWEWDTPEDEEAFGDL